MVLRLPPELVLDLTELHEISIFRLYNNRGNPQPAMASLDLPWGDDHMFRPDSQLNIWAAYDSSFPGQRTVMFAWFVSFPNPSFMCNKHVFEDST